MSQLDNNSQNSFGKDQTDDEEPINQLYIRAKQGQKIKEMEQLQQDLQKGKSNEIRDFVKSLHSSQLQQIDNIIGQHKERIFASNLEVDPESKLGRSKNFQSENIAHLNILHSQQIDQVNERDQRASVNYQQLTASQQLQNNKQQSPIDQDKQYRQKTITTSISSASKKKGALWKALNRDKADFEQQFREFLNDKKMELHKPPPVNQAPYKYKPTILKNKDSSQFEKGVEESELGSCYSELSDFAYGNAIDIMENFRKVFDLSEEEKQATGERHRMRIKNFRDDEVFIVCCLYQQIKKQNPEEKDGITKEMFEQGLLKNAHLLQVFNLNPSTLGRVIEKFETRKHDVFNLNEVIQFMLNPLREPSANSISLNNEELRLLRRKQRPPQEPSQCLLQEEQLQLITDAFHAIDTFGDNVISLKQLLHALRNDPRVVSLLPVPTVYIPEVKKTLPFERVIYELEQQMYLGTEKDKKTREKITWEQLMDSLQNYVRKDIPTKDKVIQAQRMTGNFSSGDVIEIPKQLIQYLKDRYEQADKKATYFIRKFEFADQIIHDQLFIKQYSLIIVRECPYIYPNQQQSQEPNRTGRQNQGSLAFVVPIETAEQAMQRLKQEADEYIDLDEIIDFFTRKGRPNQVARAMQTQELQQQQSKVERIMGVKDGSDLSSPDENDLREKRKQRKQEKVFGKSVAEMERQKREEKERLKQQKLKGKAFGAMHKGEDEEMIVTVPQPFKFEERDQNKPKTIRQQKLEEMLEEKKAIEDAIVKIPGTFRANRVPKHVKNRNLLNKIMEEQQKRREIVKENSKRLTKQNENPFSFYYRDLEKILNKNESQQSVEFELFKAREAPWFCSVDMLDRIQNEKAERSQTYVKMRMQQLQKMSKLPEGIKRMLERLKEKDQIMEERRARAGLEFTFQPEKAKSAPTKKQLEQRHKNFENLLNKKKQKMKLTKPIGFKFRQSRKAPVRDYLDQENLLIKKTKVSQRSFENEKNMRKKIFTNVKYQPPSTLKFEAYSELRKRQEEQKVLDEEEKQQRELDKEYRREQFAKFVRSSGAIQDNKEAMIIQQQLKNQSRQQDQRQWEQDFDKMMTNMMRRVIKRPLLVESASQDNYGQDRQTRLRWLLGEDNELGNESQQEGKSMGEQPEEYETETGLDQQEQYQQQQGSYDQYQQNRPVQTSELSANNDQQQQISQKKQGMQQQTSKQANQQPYQQKMSDIQFQMQQEIPLHQQQQQQYQKGQLNFQKQQQQLQLQQQQQKIIDQQLEQQSQSQQQNQMGQEGDEKEEDEQEGEVEGDIQIDGEGEGMGEIDESPQNIDQQEKQLQQQIENQQNLLNKDSNQNLENDEDGQEGEGGEVDEEGVQVEEGVQDEEGYDQEDPNFIQMQQQQQMASQSQPKQPGQLTDDQDQKQQQIMQQQQQQQLKLMQMQQQQQQQLYDYEQYQDQDQPQDNDEDDDEDYDQQEIEEQLKQIIPGFDKMTKEEQQQAIIYLQQHGLEMNDEDELMGGKYNQQQDLQYYQDMENEGNMNNAEDDGEDGEDVRQHSY